MKVLADLNIFKIKEITGNMHNGSIDKREFEGLHVLKFICAIFVIGIHTGFPKYNDLLMGYSAIAVPIFFMISGFFIGGYQRDQRYNKIRCSIIKILKLSIWANLLYFVLTFPYKIVATGNIDMIRFVGSNIWALFRSVLFTGCEYGIHLWYLTSFVHVLLLYMILCKLKVKEKWYFLIVIISLLANLSLGTYSNLVGLDAFDIKDIWNRNAVTVGLPSFLLGVVLNNHKYIQPLMKYRHSLIFGMVLCQYMELLLIGKYGCITFSTLPLSVMCIVVFMCKNVKGLVVSPFKYLGRKHSSNIYIWHYGFIYMYDMLRITAPILNKYHSFVFVSVSTVFFSLIIEILKFYFNRYSANGIKVVVE